MTNAIVSGKYRVSERGQHRVVQNCDDDTLDLSVMDSQNPAMLESIYARVMLQPLVFLDAPQDVVLFGLGGGQQVKFLHRYFTTARVTAVEIDPTMVELARSHFMLPADDERLRVVVEDAAAYMREDDSPCDLILSDCYDGDQIAEALHTREFYEACYRKLRPGGIMTVNILRPPTEWANQVVATVAAVFPYWQFHVVAPDQGIIVLWKTPPTHPLPALKARAAALDAVADIGFTGFVEAFGQRRGDA